MKTEHNQNYRYFLTNDLRKYPIDTDFIDSLPARKRKFINNFEGFSSKKISLKSVTALLWSITNKKYLFFALVTTMMFTFSTAALPSVTQWTIDQAVEPYDFTYAWFITATTLIIGFISAMGFTSFMRWITYSKLMASYLIINAITEQSMRLGRTLRNRLSAGEIVSIGTADVRRTAELTSLLNRIFGLCFGIVTGLFFLSRQGSFYATTAFIVNIVMIICVSPILLLVYKREHIYRTIESEQTGRSGDIVSGLRILAGIGGMKVFEETFTESSERTRKAKLHSSLPWVLGNMIIVLSGTILVAIVIYVSYGQVQQGNLTVGQYSQVVGQSSIYAGFMWGYVEVFFISIFGRVSVQRIFSFLRIVPDNLDDSASVSAPATPGILTDAQSQVSIEPGTVTVVVAERLEVSTALARRLSRVDSSASGVQWGGIPMEHIKLQDVRSRIILADNDDLLFTGTLLHNITMGKDFSTEQVQQAMHVSACDDLLDILDDGLYTYIREKATNLSGGQRQRVRLARSLLFNPEILMLIDPTSAVDASVEKIIAARLAKYRRKNPDSSTVIISNSPHIAHQADTIVVLDAQGNTLVQGDKATVMQDPRFRKIVLRSENVDHLEKENAGA